MATKTQHGETRSPKEHVERQMDYFFSPCRYVITGTKKNRLFPRSWPRANCPQFLKLPKFPREAVAILGELWNTEARPGAVSTPSRLPAQGQAKVTPRLVGWRKWTGSQGARLHPSSASSDTSRACSLTHSQPILSTQFTCPASRLSAVLPSPVKTKLLNDSFTPQKA